ncbi:predicted protein [Phaeodactylum tricornutum CCAP 1055/1]|uniref:DUF7467 domain-containing protein n=3 Tax=Phaeodactylum tricornutum TaxID=2850 RepID=B7GEN2_PHATC|nr:predicted protein [Phaeodactylum tricornutum CCAP 1055/1]EEC42941.1 predicted protein [Phaeodactylum tricornutum CCAP 1055/1]|eukprot:XP_002185576.1 predicted protein [Phaeodactylum tricornutum CCAP 1055/1]
MRLFLPTAAALLLASPTMFSGAQAQGSSSITGPELASRKRRANSDSKSNASSEEKRGLDLIRSYNEELLRYLQLTTADENSLVPTPGPTLAGAEVPTEAPLVPSECIVDVDITCTLGGSGLPCESLTAPPLGICVPADGSDLSIVTFEFQSTPCAGGDNDQGTDAVCSDVGPGVPPSGADVSIVCEDNAEMSAIVLTVTPSSGITAGDTFTVEEMNGGPLPLSMVCTISDTGSGAVLQTNTFDLSGDVSLDLKDSFGSLILVSCNDVTCIEELNFVYNLSNVGPDSMTFLDLFRDFNGVAENLVSQVTPNPLLPGQSTSVSEEFTIDVCTPGLFRISIAVEAEPANGPVCLADDVIEFSINERPTTPTTPCSDLVASSGGICEVVLDFVYTFENVGPNAFTVTAIFRKFNTVTNDIVDQLTPNPLAAGVMTTISESFTIDVCIPNRVYRVTLDAEAEPENGPFCQDNDIYEFIIGNGSTPTSKGGVPTSKGSVPTPSAKTGVPTSKGDVPTSGIDVTEKSGMPNPKSGMPNPKSGENSVGSGTRRRGRLLRDLQ